jgi:transcription elongation factor GreB
MYQDHFLQADLSLLIFYACLSRFLSEMMGRISKVPEDVKKSARAADDSQERGRLPSFHGVHPHLLGALNGSRWEDYEMRKGFTRELQRDEPATRGTSYITPGGLQRLRDEHQFLLTRERPAVVKVVTWAASNGDRSENADYQYGKRRLRQIDGRIRFLTQRIEAAQVVDPEAPREEQLETRAFFGATVRYANAAGAERVVSIVGTDEIDLNRNHISWVSPLGRALMKSAADDSVVLQAPGGTEDLTVLEVCYQRILVEPFREPPGSQTSAK